MYAVLIYVIGSVLFLFSIFDIRAQKKKYWEDMKEREEMMSKSKKKKNARQSRLI